MRKILGGTTGRLKCENCGDPRYPGVELCPKCYYSQMKYYVIKVHHQNPTGVSESYWCQEVIRAVSTNHAATKKYGKDYDNGADYHHLTAVDSYKAFDKKADAVKYLNEKLHEEVNQCQNLSQNAKVQR